MVISAATAQGIPTPRAILSLVSNSECVFVLARLLLGPGAGEEVVLGELGVVCAEGVVSARMLKGSIAVAGKVNETASQSHNNVAPSLYWNSPQNGRSD